MTAMWLILITVAAYLIGSINFAIVFGKITRGDDIRTHGSGNAGATNALRTYGKLAAAAVTLGDVLKAVVSCVLAIMIANFTPLGAENKYIAVYCAGVGAVLGHNFPLYFKFKGGKGVLVSITALMFANWKIAVAVFAISIIIMAVTKYVSLGSVMGAIIFVIAALVFEHGNIPYIIFTIILAALILWRHRTNISRLLNGTESKLTGGKK